MIDGKYDEDGGFPKLKDILTRPYFGPLTRSIETLGCCKFSLYLVLFLYFLRGISYTYLFSGDGMNHHSVVDNFVTVRGKTPASIKGTPPTHDTNKSSSQNDM